MGLAEPLTGRAQHQGVAAQIVLVLILEDLVSDQEAVSPRDMPANQIQGHSLLREKTIPRTRTIPPSSGHLTLRVACFGVVT
jgi:hypothetical protein